MFLFNALLLVWAATMAQAQVDFTNELRLSVQAHDQATTLFQWKSSPHNPHQLFANASAPDLCAAASSLSDEDMNLFYARFEELAAQPGFSCMKKRLDQHRLYLELEKLKGMDNMFPLPSSNLSTAKLKFGPSTPVELDTTGGPLIVSGDLPRKHLVLTFDDGPHPRLTMELLKILKNHELTINFFVTGENSRYHSSALVASEKAGHIIGTHSLSHKHLPDFSFTEGRKEIDGGFNGALSVVDQVAPFFRFPYGANTRKLRDYLRNSDLAEFLWNIDTLDWKIKNPRELREYALKKIEQHQQGVVLFHDIQPQTIAMLPALLKELERRGFRSLVFTPKDWIKK